MKSMKGTLLTWKNLSFARPETTKNILGNLSFSIQEWEILAVMGPSWVGKSTFLELIAGLHQPTAWTLAYKGEIISSSKEKRDQHSRENIGIVFQSDAVFPWLTVKKHILFGMANKDRTKQEKEEKCAEILSHIGLEKSSFLYPHQLSGGMKQRLSVGMVLANDAPCLLMDEPFSALDIATRKQMQDFLLSIHKKYNKTIVFITHQVDEALMMADRILLMKWSGHSWREEISISMKQEERESDTQIVSDYRKKLIAELG